MIKIAALDKLDMSEKPFAPGWKGRSVHIGPVEAVTPLLDMLAGKTTCATLTMMSGVLLWGCQRLKHFTETDFCYELAEATFARHYDWRYVDVTAPPYYSPPDDPAEEVAIYTLDNFIRDSIDGDEKWHSFYQPVTQLFHMCHMVNFILPKVHRPVFDSWLTALSKRLDQIALAPDMEVPDFYDFKDEAAYHAHCAPRHGRPLPPLVLDMDVDITGIDLQSEADGFLQKLDPKKNRFLLSPEKLLEQGFKGVPYKGLT